MAQPIQPFSITAPGFYGLNLQDSPIDMDMKYALKASNCIIDSAGRIASRKGWAKQHTANTELSTSNVTCIGELVSNTGTVTMLSAGGGYLYKLVGTTLTTLTYGGGGSAPTISANNWQFVQLNGIGIFFQRGHDPLIYDPAVSTTTFRRLSEHATYAGTVPQANTAISAYGRIWCADTATDKNTITWSDIITPQIWTGGTAGSLDLLGVWPEGGDEIVALAAHNNFLVIFGKTQILIYSGANDPASMVLSDIISTVGCIARDSIQNVGRDLIFLSTLGLHTLGRVIQEKSSPMADLSRNVRDEIVGHTAIEANPALIKSIYSTENAFYLLTFPTASEVYCFDLRAKLENGAARMTTWTSNVPTAFCSTSTGVLYFGKAGYIGKYSTYLDDALTYRMAYISPHIDFGDPIMTSILKKIIITTVSINQPVIVKWAFDFLQRFYSQTVTVNAGAANAAYYNTSEYNSGAEYTTPVAATVVGVNASGAGRTIQVGLECNIDNKLLSLQKIDIYTKRGKLV